MKRLLIVTADDFGFSSERNKGIIETFQGGGATSASVLLNCTGTFEAMEARNYGICLGLHLNLTEGQPVGKNDYKTLTTNGIFRGRLGTKKALNEGIIDPKEIAFEIESQIRRFKELTGSFPLYVDGHQHIHTHPAIVNLFSEALERYQIKLTRVPIEISMEKRTQNKSLVPFFRQVMEESKAALPILSSHGIRSSDAFMGLSTMGRDMTDERLKEGILEAFQQAEEQHQLTSPGNSDKQELQISTPKKEVTCELMTHPGYPTNPDFGGFSWGSDDFGMSNDRSYEKDILTGESIMSFYKFNGIELVSHEALL